MTQEERAHLNVVVVNPATECLMRCPSPICNLLTRSEFTLITDALISAYMHWEETGAHQMLVRDVEAAIQEEGLDRRWNVDSGTLLGKLEGLDEWEADYLLRILVTQSVRLHDMCNEDALVEAGLTWSERPPLAAHDCGHAAATAFCSPVPAGAADGSPRAGPCLECCAEEANRAAAAQGWAQLRGHPRDVLTATELRAQNLRLIRLGEEWGDFGAGYSHLLLEYLGSAPDTAWWLQHQGCDVAEIIQEVREEALKTATQTQMARILADPNKDVRNWMLHRMPAVFEDRAKAIQHRERSSG